MVLKIYDLTVGKLKLFLIPYDKKFRYIQDDLQVQHNELAKYTR